MQHLANFVQQYVQQRDESADPRMVSQQESAEQIDRTLESLGGGEPSQSEGVSQDNKSAESEQKKNQAQVDMPDSDSGAEAEILMSESEDEQRAELTGSVVETESEAQVLESVSEVSEAATFDQAEQEVVEAAEVSLSESEQSEAIEVVEPERFSSEDQAQFDVAQQETSEPSSIQQARSESGPMAEFLDAVQSDPQLQVEIQSSPKSQQIEVIPEWMNRDMFRQQVQQMPTVHDRGSIADKVTPLAPIPAMTPFSSTQEQADIMFSQMSYMSSFDDRRGT